MELFWPHASSGKHGAAGEGFSVGNSRMITQILEQDPEDDFECTYFRTRTTRAPTKAKKCGGLFPMTISYTFPSELSDGYTDSDSESDNTSNVERWLESLPANDAWSSTPNYSALDGSEALEGVDEIQEDSAKSPADRSSTFSKSTNDSQSFTSEIEDSEIRMTGSDLAKRASARRNETSEIVDRLDRKAARKKLKKTLKTRQKIPPWTRMKRETGIIIEKKRVLEAKEKEKDEAYKLLSKSWNIPEGNIPCDEKAAIRRCNNLDTTESRTAIKEKSIEEDGYDEMMQEMVNRLLTVSAGREDESTSERIVEKSRTKVFARIDSVENLKILSDIKKLDETVDSCDPSRLGIKRARFSSTIQKFSPKLSNTKISENELSKCQMNASKDKTKIPNQKRIRKISRGRKPSTAYRKPGPVIKTRYAIASKSFDENIDPGKKKSKLRTVRFEDEVPTLNSSESWRQAAIVRAARNKQILQTVEQIVDGIQSEEFHYRKKNICAEPGEVQSISRNSISKCEPGDTIELKKCGSWRSNRKRPMPSIEDKTIESKRPIFSNPFVEQCLDKAMDLALSKYKRPRNTWAEFNKEKLREQMLSAAYEPPTKKLKPKSFTPSPKLENMQRQDFSILNSWQSIHNYFLSHSSCK